MEQAAFRVMSYLLLKNFRRIWKILYEEYNGEELKRFKGLLFNSMNVDERELKWI